MMQHTLIKYECNSYEIESKIKEQRSQLLHNVRRKIEILSHVFIFIAFPSVKLLIVFFSLSLLFKFFCSAFSHRSSDLMHPDEGFPNARLFNSSYPTSSNATQFQLSGLYNGGEQKYQI